MAHRLISPPIGLGLIGIEPLSGPRTVGAGANQSIGGFVQTFGAPFGLWRFRFTFHAMRGAEFRRYRGWITALHGGANATRWHFNDPDRISPAESGMSVSPSIRWDNISGLNWANGQPWSNGQRWAVSPPQVRPAAGAALGDTVITLADEFWGHSLLGGEYIGFFPFHLGLYIITDVIAPGTYRIWPSLRKAVTLDHFCTLDPTLAMRLESEEGATADRALQVAEGASVTMIEVLDYDVRDYFSDEPISINVLPPDPEPFGLMALNFADNFAQIEDDADPENDYKGSAVDAVTTSRESTATYFDADGVMQIAGANILRLDHDPVTGDPLGALIEIEDENACRYSNAIGGAVGWGLANGATVTLNHSAAPDGTTTMSLLTANGSLVARSVSNEITVPAGESRVLGVFIKKETVGVSPRIGLWDTSQSTALGYVDLDWSDTAPTVQASFGAAGILIEDCGSGVFRVRFTVNTGAFTSVRMLLYPARNIGIGSTGFWCAELKNSYSSAIPTTIAPATRAADAVTKALSSFFWNEGGGTMRLNGVETSPLTAGSELDIAGMCLAAGASHLSSLTWVSSQS
ncbi:phage head spike fiber domain-containing protein [Chelativorans oligotrophicus]|uniref:phage head spike fiber domain-containing protein n=1 Tax=Chelativorans oligotrophicus TaxID=449974 RepID=UPI001A9842ED|nr:hypothetical protein [Chelativorans oligotrophicus]